MIGFTRHVYEACWQHKAFIEAKENLKNGELCEVLDFAENYRTFYQNEIQSQHWQYRQATVHPVVAYYKCICGKLITESCVCISEDLKHDGHAVKAFMQHVHTHLEEKRGLSLNRIIQFSDGAASQYKSVKPFTQLSKEDRHIQRNFFGSRHGKSSADGASAVVKSLCRRAVKSGEAVITSASDMYRFLHEKHTIDRSDCTGKDQDHSLRTFFFVPEVERKKEEVQTYRVQDTQTLHCVENTGEFGVIKIRKLSCFCNPCESGGSCVRGIEPASEYDMKLKVQKKKPGNDQNKRKNASAKVSTRMTAKRFKSDTVVIDSDEIDMDVDDISENDNMGVEENDDISENDEIENENIHQSEDSKGIDRQPYFRLLQQDLAKSKNFSEFLKKAHSYSKEMKKYKLPDQPPAHAHLDVDIPSLPLYPADADEEHLPYSIYGDGNCLYRAGSAGTFDTEEQHVELRVRTVVEMAVHEDFYLSNDYLQKGTSLTLDLAIRYAAETDTYRDSVLTKTEIRRHYRFVNFKISFTCINVFYIVCQVFSTIVHVSFFIQCMIFMTHC